MNGKPYLFFDLDGPILDVSEKYYQVYADLVNERGGQPIPKADYWEQKRQRIPDEKILRASGLDGWSEDYRRLRRDRIETREYLGYDRVWPGVKQLLGDLKVRHTVILVTLRNSSEALNWQLGSLDLMRFFHQVLSAPGDSAEGNKAGVKVSLVRQVLGDGPLSGWFVGDTETDITAGKTLGVRTAAVAFGIRAFQLLATLAPDVLIRDPEQLADWKQGL